VWRQLGRHGLTTDDNDVLYVPSLQSVCVIYDIDYDNEASVMCDVARRHSLMSIQTKHYANGSFDGLSDLRYQLHDAQLRPLYTWIHADLNGLSTICTLGQCHD